MDRLRTMKMAAAAGNGDEQVRIEGSTAHDPAVGIDSFFLRVTDIFPPSPLRMQSSTEPPRPEGGNAWTAPKAHCHDQRQGLLWAQL